MQLWERLSMFRSQDHPLLDQLSLLDIAHCHCLNCCFENRLLTARMVCLFVKFYIGNMNSLICLNVLINAMICVGATTFVKFISTSRQLFGTELNVVDIGPAATPLNLLSTCITREDCQAVDPQRQKLLTNVSGVSATDGHAPTYISAVR